MLIKSQKSFYISTTFNEYDLEINIIYIKIYKN